MGEKNKFGIKVFCILVLSLLFLTLIANGVLGEDNIYIDSKIYEEFNSNEEWVQVIIRLNNMSEMNNFISNLSSEEFYLNGNSSKMIIAEITEEGYNKILNDDRVTAIYYNAETFIPENYKEELIQEKDFELKSGWGKIILVCAIMGIIILILYFITKR